MVSLVYRSLMSFTVLFIFLVYGLSPMAMAKGETVKENDALLIINKTTNELAYFTNGSLERIFPVATGAKPKYTPEGTFPIVNKIKNRPYYKDNIPGGDPKNPLGDRWLGLAVNGTYGTTYAIHGNNNSSSIGNYVSLGCIRMNNDDIHWLFDQITMNTNVVITSSKLSFEELAAQHHYELNEPFPGDLFINGNPIALEKEPLLYRGKTFLPLRACIELLGGMVQWDTESGLVSSTIGDRQLVHKPSTATVSVNGEAFVMEETSRYWAGTVMIPLRDMAQLTGWDVHWDPATNSIHMTTTQGN